MVTFGFKKRKALAQIPVLLGLLIMALVVPAATKLVQENQDTRNRAASVISPPPSGCTDGYVRCFNNIQQRCQNGSWVFQKNCPNGCSGNYCKVIPTNTPRPPTPTPINCPNGACTIEGSFKCSLNKQYRCDGECWDLAKLCPNGCNENICASIPTLTPTKVPPSLTPTLTTRPTPTLTPKPSSYTCSSLGGSCVSYGCTCGTFTEGTCQGEDECCRPCLTSTPKPTATLTPTKPPTLTPTRAPSPTPTTACTGTCQYSDCLIMNMKTGVGACPRPQYCCGEKIIAPKCNLGDKYCATDNSGVWVCKSDRSDYTLITCSTGKKCDSTTKTCVSISTPTPTRTPTSTPTRAPTATPTTACSGTCQYSDCLTMNMKTGVGACPRPQYCCGEKIISFACNIGERTCLSDKSGVNICKPDRTGYTVFKCSEGRTCDSTTKTCVALPTATPTLSCIQENQTYQEGKCCPGLVRVKTPYGSICGKQGDCQSGERKCQGNNVLICDESGHFQIGGVCDGGCKDGKCQVLCTTGQPRCRDNKILETCNESGTGWVGESCDYACQNNSCVADPGVIPTSTPTPIDCVPGKKTCTGNKGMMECNSKGNGYNYFTCGILCVGGRCLGETITVGEPINPTNCISGEIKCEATRNGGFSEFKCNSSGFWDEILSCASGCYYGRCKQTIETENCLKENERYQEGKCCPGLVKVTSPYGYYCGKPGVCTSGTTKCENNSIWKCDTSGYFSKIKSCDFGCGGNECNFGCFPKSTKCRNEQTLQVCSDDGTAWLSRSCNYCSEGICFSSKKEAEETLAYSDTGWDGEGPLPYCYAPSAEEIGLNTCPQGYVCGAQKVEDRNGLYYCEKKTVENSTVKVCLANSSYCGQGGVLLRCSSDGMRWAAAWQCPAPRPEKGSQYNYSCKQVSTDRGQCRPPTPEEGRDTAVEIAGLTAATVASVLALPAVITNPAIASTAFRIVRIGNAAYAINNAANECQGFEGMTNDEKMKCVLAAGYAVTATVDGGLAGTGLVTEGSALLSGIEVVNDVANLTLGGVNAYNQCEGGTDKDCYYALISSGIDLVALGVDINQAKQWSKANLHVKVDNLPKENISYQANMYKMTGNSGLSYSNSGMRTPEEIRALETLTEITNEEMRYVIKGGVSVTLFDTQNEMTNYLNKNKNFSFGSNLGGIFFEEETLGGSRWVYDSEGRFIERIDSPNQKKPQIVFALDSPLALGTGFHESIHAQRSGYGIGNDGFYGLKSNLVDFFSNSELSPGARNLAIQSLEEVGTISVELDMYDQIPNLPSEFRSNAIKYQNFNSQIYLQALVDPNSMTPELAKYLKELELTDPITYKMLTADAGSVNANVNANLISKPITIPGQVYGNDPSPLLDELTIRATQLQKEGISKAESVMKSVTEVTNGQYYENYGVGGIKSVPADKAHTVEDLVTCGGMVCRSMTQISTGVANRSGLDAYQGFMTVSKNGVSTGHSFTVLKNADGSISGVIDATNSWTFNSMEDFISRIKSLGYSIDSDIDISSLKSEEVYKIIR